MSEDHEGDSRVGVSAKVSLGDDDHDGFLNNEDVSPSDVRSGDALLEFSQDHLPSLALLGEGEPIPLGK